jgi:hypothetical protein
MLIISILSVLFILLTWISIQDSYALYFGHDIPIVTHLQNSSLLPKQISATEKGDVYVVWVDKNNNNIYFSSSHNSGANFSQQVLLGNNKTSSSSSLSSSSPQIAATEKGDVYVVWVDKDYKTGNSNIEFISSSDSGLNFSSKKELRGGRTLSLSPHLSATENGKVHVVWVDKDNKTGDSDIEFISSSDSGNAFFPRKKITGGKPISFSPQISATEKGDVYVVWVDQNKKTDDTDIVFRNSNDSGMSFGDRERLRRGDSISSSFPQLTATEKGAVYVVWTDKDNKTGNTDVSFRSSHDNGTNFSRTVSLNRYEGNLTLSLTPKIVSTGTGAYVIWNDTNIQFKQILENNVVGQKISLSNKTIDSYSPLITATQKGDIYAIWIDKEKTKEDSLSSKRISEYFFPRNS